jgi:hypothetical protein
VGNLWSYKYTAPNGASETWQNRSPFIIHHLLFATLPLRPWRSLREALTAIDCAHHLVGNAACDGGNMPVPQCRNRVIKGCARYNYFYLRNQWRSTASPVFWRKDVLKRGISIRLKTRRKSAIESFVTYLLPTINMALTWKMGESKRPITKKVPQLEVHAIVGYAFGDQRAWLSEKMKER